MDARQEQLQLYGKGCRSNSRRVMTKSVLLHSDDTYAERDDENLGKPQCQNLNKAVIRC